MSAWEQLFTSAFMPHGHCLYWSPLVLWLNVLSDGLIALAYFSIPIGLFVLVRKRPTLEENRLLVLFGLFILACGTTHVLEVVTTWKGIYGVAGLVKAVTAGVSVVAAVALWPAVPRLLSLPSHRELASANAKLSDEMLQRAEAEMRARTLASELETRVRERTAELSRSRAELEQFAYVASHDLQEPLRMVSAYAELLEQDYGDRLDGEGRRYLGFAVAGAHRMQRLIEDLLEFSRLGHEPTLGLAMRLDTALDVALDNLRHAIDSSGARITRDPLPSVQADGRQVVRLLQNLVGNALKYAGDRPPRVHVSARELGALVEIAVRDEGIGIEPHHAELIFEPFRRLAGGSDGTGIGLAICRRIVELHGGSIRVDSTPGAGATFLFTLRVARAGGP
jgi:signal transduction histidine kinase